MKKTFSTFLPHVAVVLCCLLPAAGGIFFTSCTKEKEILVDIRQHDTLIVKDTLTVHDTICEDCGVGRLKNVPLLGYGRPIDRRAEAREHIEATRRKLRALGWPYDYNYFFSLFTIHEIGLMYPDVDRLYANAQRNGYSDNYYIFAKDECVPNYYSYLSDTVVIYLGGGPDYAEGDGLGIYPICLYTEVLRDYRGGYDSYSYIPATSSMLARRFNQTHTSIVTVPHSTAGLQTDIHWNCTVQFFDYESACGNFKAPWPYNILSYEDAGLLNDIGVELLRFTVEDLKRHGKTIVLFGGSWGAFVAARYLLYYPIDDFAEVTLAGFNPNSSVEMLRWLRGELNAPLATGYARLGQEIYEMQRWRMVPWLTRQNIDRLRILTGGEDERLGFPTAGDIKELTDAGATVIELVGSGHPIAAWYDEAPVTPTDTVVNYIWENHMRIYTKNGVREVHNNYSAAEGASANKSSAWPAPQKMRDSRYVLPRWK